MSAIASGWSEASIREVTSTPRKADPVTTGRERVRYVDIGLLAGPTRHLVTAPAVLSVEAPSRCRQVIADGDTLYSTVRPYLRKVALVGQGLDGHFASTGYSVLRPTPRIHPAYLYYFTLSSHFEEQILPLQKGVSYPAVLDREVRGQRIWFPQQDEQRRIVEILEDNLSGLERAVAGLNATQKRLDVLERALHQRALRGLLVPDDLGEGVGGDLVGGAQLLDPSTLDERVWDVPTTWAWVRLGDIFKVAVGTTPSRPDSSLWDGSIPWVSSGEVAFNRIRSTKESISAEGVSNLQRRVHPSGTVMLAMIGEGKTRGQAAILDINAAHNQNCASIRVSETPILPEYVYAFLKERYLETRRGSSGGNQPALNKRRIESIPIPVPPLGTQRRIVEELDAIGITTSYVRRACSEGLSRAAALRRAILAAAFEGKLTGRHTDTEVIEEMADV